MSKVEHHTEELCALIEKSVMDIVPDITVAFSKIRKAHKKNYEDILPNVLSGVIFSIIATLAHHQDFKEFEFTQVILAMVTQMSVKRLRNDPDIVEHIHKPNPFKFNA